jgi:hypothetical protein
MSSREKDRRCCRYLQYLSVLCLNITYNVSASIMLCKSLLPESLVLARRVSGEFEGAGAAGFALFVV